MFPITHYYCAKKIFGRSSSLLILGGLWPDLARGTGVGRNQAHESGKQFWQWCQKQAPDALDLARGIICHGSDPPGLDFYADESWPGGEKGWCFQAGEAWLAQVASATALPEHYVGWKAHNFVEMAFELILIKQEPDLGRDILAAVVDQKAVEQASILLSEFWHLEPKQVADCYAQVNRIFAIDPLDPYNLALKQDLAMRFRNQSQAADIEAMAYLLELIAKDKPEDYLAFLHQAMNLTWKTMEIIEEGGS
ncbi:MAG: hypothetical protein FWF85_06430 [Clostridiales bacterium]|nr:hypothetical protein [Clostridiales bacterium]